MDLTLLANNCKAHPLPFLARLPKALNYLESLEPQVKFTGKADAAVCSSKEFGVERDDTCVCWYLCPPPSCQAGGTVLVPCARGQRRAALGRCPPPRYPLRATNAAGPTSVPVDGLLARPNTQRPLLKPGSKEGDFEAFFT